MTSEEIQTLIGQMLNVQRQLQESQLQADSRLTRIEAIAESNARAIQATANESNETRRLTQQSQTQLIELARIVGQFAEATNSRLVILEDRDLNN
jgi:hypothetical protein